MTQRARPPAAFALAVLIAAMLGACSEEVDPGNDQTPLKIGVIQPLSLPGATLVRNSMELAAGQFNALGGVRGRPVELVFVEEGSRPSTAADAARQAIDEQGVEGIVGPSFPSTALAVAEIAYARGIPHIAHGGDVSEWPLAQDTADRVSFALTAPGHLSAVAAIQGWSEEMGCRKLAVVHDEAISAGAPDMEAGIANAGLESGGIHLFPSEIDSYASYIGPVSETGSDCVLLALDGDAMSRIIDDWAAVGAPDVQFILGRDPYGGPNLIGLPGASQDVRTPGAESWVEFEELFRASYGEPQLPATQAVAYDAMMLMLLAFEAAGTTDADAFRQAVLRVSRRDNIREEIFFGPAKVAATVTEIRDGVEVDYSGASGIIDLKAVGYPLMRYELWYASDGGADFEVERRIYIDR